jgi:hypothetical protein
MYRILLLFVFIAGILLKPETGNAQYLKLALSDGTIQNSELTSVRNLIFTDKELIVNLKNGSNHMYGISDINKLFFGELTTAIIQPVNNTANFAVYPNPVTEKLYFKNLSVETETVYIFRIDGILLLQKETRELEAGIDFQQFTPGMYLVKAGNQTTKFVKQ